MTRIDKENYYLDIAETVLKRATCLRRCYGAIIVKNDEIVATGYNGAPRGRRNCTDLGYCTREALQVPSGQRYELCRSVHAEANAIISAARSECIGGTIYKVKVVFNESGTETMEDKILRIIRNEVVTAAGTCDIINAPQMSRQSERSAS